MKLGRKGFTMVELLIVLLIVGILAAVAAPLYLAQTDRARASEAVGALSLIRQAERDYFTRHNVYIAVGTGNLANSPDDAAPGLDINVGATQYFSNDSYSVALVATGGTFGDGTTAAVDFLITASGAASDPFDGGTGLGARHNTDVATFTLEMDNSGRVVLQTSTGGAWREF